MRQHRPVEQIAKACLVVAVHVGVAEHVVALAVRDVDVLFKNDAILGERTGFIGAEDVDGAEVLDRVEVFDDDLLFGHGHGTLREIDCHDHRQHFRGQSDCYRQGEEKRLGPIALGDPDDEENDADHDHHEADHEPRETGNAPVEAGLNAFAGELFGNRAEMGAHAGVHRDTAGGTAENIAALKAGVRQFDDPAACNLRRVGIFLHRHGFAGQGRLAHKKIFGRDEPEVGRDDGTSLKGDNVARDNFRRGNFAFGTVPRDEALCLNHFAELLHCLARAVFLEVGEADAQNEHATHDRRGPHVAHEKGHDADDEQLDDERVPAALDDLADEPEFLAVGEVVWTELLKGFFHLFRGETAAAHTHFFQCIGRGFPADFD